MESTMSEFENLPGTSGSSGSSDPRIPRWYGCCGVTLSILFFVLIQKTLVDHIIPRRVLAQDQWKWRNLLVSWIHALIAAVWAVSCAYRYPELVEDVIDYYNVDVYFLVTFTTGYFAVDFYDIMATKQYMNWSGVIAHHIAGLLVMGYNISECRYLGMNVLVLIAEVNSVFLHTRKLLQMFQVRFDNLLYRVNSIVNLITFVCCRFVLLYVLYAIYIYFHRLSLFYSIIVTPSMTVMALTNIILFWRLIYSDVIRPFRSSSGKTKRVSQNGTGHATATGFGNSCLDTSTGSNGLVKNNNTKKIE